MCGIVAPQDYALQLSVTWYVLGFPMTSVCVCVESLDDDGMSAIYLQR